MANHHFSWINPHHLRHQRVNPHHFLPPFASRFQDLKVAENLLRLGRPLSRGSSDGLTSEDLHDTMVMSWEYIYIYIHVYYLGKL